MKKTLFYILLIIAGLFCSYRPALAGNPSGVSNTSEREITTQERLVGEFSRLSSAGSTPITYIQSNISKVVIEGNPEHISKMITEVRGGTLYIEMQKGSYRNLNLHVTVFSPVLDEVSMSGSGSFHDKNGHKTNGDIRYSSAGSGKFNIGRIECASFDAHLAGSGTLSVEYLMCSGNASLSTSGSGGLTVQKMVSKGDVSLRLSGSGYGLLDDVEIGDLKIHISGSGSVKVNGLARDVSASISGSGSVMGNLEFRHLNAHTSGSGSVRL